MNFEKVYNEYLIYVKKRHKKQGFITINQDFNNHILPYFENEDIKCLTKINILKWQDKIYEKNFSNKYNSKLYYVFNSFIEFCILKDYITTNYLKEIGTFKKKIEYKKHITYNIFQFFKFRFFLKEFVDKQYYTFMYFYGSRPGETMAFRFIDLKKHKYMCVFHNLTRKYGRELETPKNQSSIRAIKINIFMRFRIWILKLYYKKVYGVFRDDYFIFGGPKPLATTTLDRHKKNACIKAKLPLITQHEFRHSCATRKIHHKVPIDKVSTLLGHSKVSTTLDNYVHNEKNTLNVLSQ